jgi:hypothetical protein
MALKGSGKSTCSTCGKLRDVKWDSWCKKCRKEYRENRRKQGICVDCGLYPISKNSNSVCDSCLFRKSKSNRERRNECKTQAVNSLGGKCFSCGLKTDCVDVYDFHHINPSEKDIEVAKLFHLSFLKVFEELKKCILLCANCHRRIHAMEMYEKYDEDFLDNFSEQCFDLPDLS